MAKSTRSTAAVQADPPPPSQSPEPRTINWSAVKRRYQHDRKWTGAEIAKHYGIPEALLREHARQYGWRRPDNRGKRDRAQATPPGTMRERIIAIMEGRLTQMEIELQSDQLPPTTVVQRHTSELNRMIRSLGPAKAAATPAIPATTPGAGDDDQDAWRRELVERIKALKHRLTA
ncbi:MAG: hypothetical protein U1E49_00090 [Hyphomicrobiaceae bacterium]